MTVAAKCFLLAVLVGVFAYNTWDSFSRGGVHIVNWAVAGVVAALLTAMLSRRSRS